MLDFFKKRKEYKIQQEYFDIIKLHLTSNFKRVYVVRLENIVELSDFILYGINTVVKARINESKSIHIRIEDINGYLFEGFTENYKWFVENFNF